MIRGKRWDSRGCKSFGIIGGYFSIAPNRDINTFITLSILKTNYWNDA